MEYPIIGGGGGEERHQALDPQLDEKKYGAMEKSRELRKGLILRLGCVLNDLEKDSKGTEVWIGVFQKAQQLGEWVS